MKWYLKVLKQYADFNGRARRQEYWMFILFNLLFAFIAIFLDNMLGLTIGRTPYGILYFLYAIIVFMPGLAVAVRRLHDTGKSGWMVLVSLIPLIGAIWVLVLMVTEGDVGDNAYGSNPKTHPEGAVTTNDSSGVAPVVGNGDTLLIICLVWMLFSTVFWSLITNLFQDAFSMSWFQSFSTISQFIWAVVPILLALAIRDQSKKRIAFVICGVCIIIELFKAALRFNNISF